MRRILLTSSQVSILLSALISKTLPRFPHSIPHPRRTSSNPPTVISCTFALFLSGYVLQQRTLRDLRTAIRPRQSRPKPQMYLPDHFKPKPEVLADGSFVQGDSPAAKEQREMVIEVSHTASEHEREEDEARRAAAPSEKVALVEQLKAQMEQKSWAVEHPDPMVKSKVPVSRAERRRLIKEEIQRLAQSEERVYYQRRLW